jgi:transposase
LCNLAITQATHPQNQAGKKHVSFASRQRKATLQCTNSGLHDKPEIHSGFIPPYSPDLAPSDFSLFSKLKETLKGQHFLSDAEVEAAMRKRISINPKT